jgi:thymidine kinase
MAIRGKLLFVTGCMFSGKTHWLLEKYLQMKAGSINTYLFKNSFDDERKGNLIKSRTGVSHPAISMSSLSQMEININKPDPNVNFIFIDEIQFFPASDIEYIGCLLDRGFNFIVSGLDTDSNGDYFPISEKIVQIADFVEILYARCFVCNSPARNTYVKQDKKELYLLDSGDNYESRCDQHINRDKK